MKTHEWKYFWNAFCRHVGRFHRPQPTSARANGRQSQSAEPRNIAKELRAMEKSISVVQANKESPNKKANLAKLMQSARDGKPEDVEEIKRLIDELKTDVNGVSSVSGAPRPQMHAWMGGWVDVHACARARTHARSEPPPPPSFLSART